VTFGSALGAPATPVTGTEAAEILVGGAGDDAIAVPFLDFHRIDGGGGTDTLVPTRAG